MKVYFDMIGCRLNQAEIEYLAQKFVVHGDGVVPDASNADIIIVNTCCVTAKAAADSRKMIRHYANNSSGQVIVTGCWGTLFREKALSLPSVSHVIRNLNKENLVEKLFNLPYGFLDNSNQTRTPLEGSRRRTRAFVKVQDGCDQHCTYCLTRIARGKSRSSSTEEILSNINNAVRGGAKEVVLTGVQLGSWGKDLFEDTSISNLIKTIIDESIVERVRLSSIEPWDIDQDLINLFENSRLCPHLHIPLQSGTASTLKRMARRMTPDRFHLLISTIKKKIPEIAITTDIIVGFPGETDSDFEETRNFVNKLDLAGGHVFSYSPMQGTPAANFASQVPSKIKKQRNLAMRESFYNSRSRFMHNLVGKEVNVLWEKSERIEDKYLVSGLTDTYVPIHAHADKDVYNQISKVLIQEVVNNKYLKGKIINHKKNRM